MRRNRLSILAALLAAAAPTALAAQVGTPGEIVQASSPDADALAEQVRLLAANPLDLDALVTAGELATRLGDTGGAENFFARARSVNPANPRLIAANAVLLVRTEHPGEALAQFAKAERAGHDITPYLPDRGLAYDLVGDQPRAQRDYRRALQRDNDDETVRRYALSLAISGQREAALDQLDPLIRRSDRAAWRIRCFVLAMTGDIDGAKTIASDMLPAGMAAGLNRFFTLLPGMSATDKAFAVHFGELHGSNARLADARLAPPLPPIPLEPVARPAPPPVVLAAVDTGTKSKQRPRRGRRVANDRPAVSAADAPTPLKLEFDPQPPSPQPPRLEAEQLAIETQQQLAASRPIQTIPPESSTRIPRNADVVTATPTPIPEPAPTPAPASPPSRGLPERPSETVSTATPTVAAPTRPAPAPDIAPAQPKPRKASRPVREETDILEAIVSNLDAPAPSTKGASAPATKPSASAATADDPCKPAKTARKGAPTRGRKAAACPTDEKPTAKTAKAKDEPAKKEPARVWVQVAGGANEESLVKAWAAVKAKAPAAFKGRQGWTTPLRATNRVLTGPFKTRQEAQSFVNTLAKSDVSAFVFESTAGQKVSKLGAP